MKSLLVKSHLLPRPLLLVCTASAGCAFASSTLAGAWPVAAGLGLGMHGLMFSLSTTLEADAEMIRCFSGATRWEMKWSEVSSIETSPSGKIVLHGDNKRLVLPSPILWRSERREEMLQFIQSQAQAWNIPREQTRRANLQGCKNTKVMLPKRPKPPVSL